ncbi:hypothetical protein DVH24_010334 [Malus domestica]|uniref:Transmembrane protein n=1 Tax=Malus domestica TaxID=3750 RepID=A0A498JPY6_MALDO|nr:hypothetical protein DVH24_010334 [Malus domestica]
MNLFDNPHFFPLQILRLLSLYSSFIWRSHQTSIFVPPDFFNNRCSWPDVTIGEASVGWWRGFVLVGMLGGGCCSRSLGFLLLYFMAWAFTVCWNYWASMAGSLLG